MKRELLEETGLDVKLVRELGVLRAAGPARSGLSAREAISSRRCPTGPTEDEWEHFIERGRGRAGSRALPLGADPRGHVRPRAQPRRVPRSLAAQARRRLRHPRPRAPRLRPQGDAGGADTSAGGPRRCARRPRGGTRPRGRGGDGACRQFESSPNWQMPTSSSVFSAQAPTAHRRSMPWQTLDGPSEWEHPVTGTGMDAGLVFVCRWVPLDDAPPLWGKADPLVERLRRSIGEQ